MYIWQKRHSISFYILFALICLFTLEEVCYAKELPKDIEMSDTTLREALDELEGCLGIKITVDESPKDPLNLFFQEGQSIEEVLEMLAEITNKEVKKISNHEFLLEEVQIQKEEISKEYHLHYLRSQEIVDVLKELFSDVKVANLESRNQVIVVAEEKKIHEIDKLMEHMDIEGKQVKVYSQILDISKDLFHELGFDWLYEKPSQQKNKFSVAVLGEESVGNSGPVLGSKWNLIRQFSNATEALGLSLKLLEARQDLKITSSPSILIAHGNKGEFKITEEVIVGEKKEKKKGESTSVEPIFKEAGLILKVIPYIHQDNSVTLDISLELSDFRYRQTNHKKDWNFNSQGGSKMGRSLSTRIHVKNKEMILIGGLSRFTRRNTENKVPFLSDIPGLGYLFKSESKKDAETDMYIKIFIEVCE